MAFGLSRRARVMIATTTLVFSSMAAAQADGELKKEAKLAKKLFGAAKYPAASLGSELNGEYTKLVNDCNVVSKDAFKFIDFKPDVIPSDVRSDGKLAPLLNARVVRVDGAPLATLFRYPFSKEDFDRLKATLDSAKFANFFRIAAGRVIGVNDELLNRVDILPSGAAFSNTLYTRSCAGYVNSELAGNVDFPIAKLKAAMNQEFSSSRMARTLAGTFRSPYVDMLQKQNIVGMYLRMALWKAYAEYSNDPGRPAVLPEFYIAKILDAVLIASATQTRSTTRVSASAAAAASAGIASGTLNAEAARADDSSYAGNAFNILLFAPNDYNSAFQKLPGPARLASDFAQVSGSTQPDQPLQSLELGVSHSHSFTIFGVPSSICNSAWKTADMTANVYQGTPVVVGVSRPVFIEGNALDACGLTVTGLPTTAATAAAGAVALSYTLVNDFNQLQIADSAAGGDNFHRIKFPFKLSLSSSGMPRIYAGEDVRQLVAVPGSPSSELFVWNLPVIAEDPSSAIRYNGTDSILAPFEASCGVYPAYPVKGVFRAGADKHMSLTLTSAAALKTGQEKWASVTCHASPTVTIPINPSGSIQRQLDLKFQLPSVSPDPSNDPVLSSMQALPDHP